MNAKWNGEYLNEAVNRHNKFVDILNNIMPDVVKIIDGARITNDGLDKKTRTKIYALLPNTDGMRSYVKCYLDDVYVNCDFNSHVSVTSVAYSDLAFIRIATKTDNKWSGVTFEPLTKVSLTNVNNMLQDVETAKKAHDEALKAYNNMMSKARIWCVR